MIWGANMQLGLEAAEARWEVEQDARIQRLQRSILQAKTQETHFS